MWTPTAKYAQNFLKYVSEHTEVAQECKDSHRVRKHELLLFFLYFHGSLIHPCGAHFQSLMQLERPTEGYRVEKKSLRLFDIS